jgi:hypothetical protein
VNFPALQTRQSFSFTFWLSCDGDASFRSLLKEVPSYGVFLEGEAFDLGTIEGYQYL